MIHTPDQELAIGESVGQQSRAGCQVGCGGSVVGCPDSHALDSGVVQGQVAVKPGCVAVSDIDVAG